MKNKVKFIATCLGITFAISGINFSYTASAKKSYDDSNIYYLSKKIENGQSEKTTIAKSKTVKTYMNKSEVEAKVNYIDKKGINSLSKNTPSTVWVDEEFLQDSDMKTKIKELYNNGNKIVIRGENISRLEGISYLDLNMEGVPKEERVDEKLKPSAVILEKVDELSYNCTGLNVEQYNDDEVERGMLYISRDTFNDKVRQLKQEKKGVSLTNNANSIFKKNIAHASEWDPVQVLTWTDQWIAVTVSSTQDCKKDSANPSNGQYRSSHQSIVQADVTNKLLYEIKSVTIYQDGGGSSTINNYAPADKSATSSISGQFPWGVGVSLDSDAFVSIKKESGGINSKSVQIKFADANPLLDYESMNGMVTSEQYQSSDYFSSGMRYTVSVDTSADIFYGYASASHYVGGY